MNDKEHLKTNNVLLSAVRRLCRPLVKLLIEKGITYPQLRDMFKELYVEVADHYEPIKGKKPSISRAFILTGVHRKDIARLRAESKSDDEPSSNNSSLGSELVARWLGSEEFQDKKGKPRPLTRSGTDSLPGFDDLVISVSKDVRPRAILDEWIRLEIVSIDESKTISLNQSAFVPQKGLEEKAFFLGRHVHDHLAACTHNILEDKKPFMERSVFFSGLTNESVEKLRDIAEHQGMQLLQDLNQQAISLQKADKQKSDADQRMRLGLYWFQEQQESDDDANT
ncbi:MAG: DUF6502 family protein [Gammaproteobacteria bacterium]